MAIYRSQDGGESWEDISLGLPDWCKQAEPNAIVHDGTYYIIARNQINFHLIQLRWTPGGPIEAKDTNISSKLSVDTSDIFYNERTQRFEVVQSNRGNRSVVLFSLAPKDWDTAEWRLEGTLFQRGGSFYSTFDGFHTGGALVEPGRGVQHIFIYSGHAGGPAGVFRITRTLNTLRLAKFLNQGP